MTNVYFVRHAEPDYRVHDDLTRPLTEKGLRDCALVTEYFRDKEISAVVSSPYARARDTVSGAAKAKGLEVTCIGAFVERRITDGWIGDFSAYAKRQWEDFDYKLPGGESLNEVQTRNIRALNQLLDYHSGGTVVIGSHGTALSTVINYYDSSFSYASFLQIVDLMPFIVLFAFDGKRLAAIKPVNLFEDSKKQRIGAF
jgi:Fructose-2,6-bisphosphatase